MIRNLVGKFTKKIITKGEEIFIDLVKDFENKSQKNNHTFVLKYSKWFRNNKNLKNFWIIY